MLCCSNELYYACWQCCTYRACTGQVQCSARIILWTNSVCTLYKFALLLMCSEQLAKENLCNFHSVLLHCMLTALNMPTYAVYIDAVAHTGYAILKCSMNLLHYAMWVSLTWRHARKWNVQLAKLTIIDLTASTNLLHVCKFMQVAALLTNAAA